MRLINCHTKELVWFTDGNIPDYAIVSHRWEGQETTMYEYEQQRLLDSNAWCPGVKKAMRSCEEALQRGLSHVWIDTCCIHKDSSTELQEAINSMFRWYQAASICLVYLNDVTSSDDLAGSVWFTRGWTLQELLAPVKAVFLDKDWGPIGTRDELLENITDITKIPSACFGDRRAIHRMTVAHRMSWMATRQTTCIEDLAYCMLGLFDISMPMLYGEGSKAFRRLQREILNEIEDESIFLWLHPAPLQVDGAAIDDGQFLAPDPRCFNVCRANNLTIDNMFVREPYRMTNRGLEFEVFGKRSERFRQHLRVPLNCLMNGKRVVLPLVQCSDYWSRRETEYGMLNQWKREFRVQFILEPRYARELPAQDMHQFFNEKLRLQKDVLPQSSHVPDKASQAIDEAVRYDTEIVKFKIFIR